MNLILKSGLIFIVHCFIAVFSGNAQNKITSYQYWFDNDYSSSETVAVTPSEQMNLAATLPLENLNGGLHIITIRFKDSSGKWSVPVNQYFYTSKTILQENKVIGYRYWLNENIGSAKYIALSEPVKLLNLDENLDFSELASGEYVIHFQFKDISGKWSLVTSDSFTYINTSATESRAEYEISLYPNPTTGLIRITTDHVFPSDCNIEVCDYLGRIVLNQKLSGEISQVIDLSQLSKGFYYIRIKGKSSIFHQKVLLQ